MGDSVKRIYGGDWRLYPHLRFKRVVRHDRCVLQPDHDPSLSDLNTGALLLFMFDRSTVHVKRVKTSKSHFYTTGKFEKVKLGSSVAVVVLFLTLNGIVINKFHDDFEPKSVAAATEVKDEGDRSKKEPAEEVEKKVVELNAELVASFEKGVVQPFPFVVGQPLDESKIGKPEVSKTYEDGLKVHSYMFNGYDVRVGITKEKQVSSISIELHTNRENIMKNMSQQLAEKSSDRQYLTFLTGEFQVSYTRQ